MNHSPADLRRALRHPLASVTLGAMASLVLVIAAVVLGPGLFDRGPHADGAGPLGSSGVAQYQLEGVEARPGLTTFTFGFPLCIRDASHTATLESVQPAVSAGAYRLLGITVRQFVPTPSDTPIYAAEGFPPAMPDDLVQIGGYVVTTPCPPAFGALSTELLVGLGVQGTDGGGWRGVDVAYRSDGVRRILHIDNDAVICGKAVADLCAPASPSPPAN